MIVRCNLPRNVYRRRSSQRVYFAYATRKCVSTTTDSVFDQSTVTGDRASDASGSRRESHPTASSSLKTRLKQVWQFHDALFGAGLQPSRSKWMRGLSSKISTSSDARKTKSPPFWYGGGHTICAPDFNALQARLKRMGDIVGLRELLLGISLPVDSPAALRQWLLFHEATVERNTLSMADCQLRFRKICKSLDTLHIPQANSWEGRRSKQQWLHVITGWSCDGVGGHGERRAWSLYSLGPELAVRCWKPYIELLSRFGKSDVVHSEWMLHHEKHDASLNALNYTIQVLVRMKDPARAWQLAYDSGDIAKSITNETWVSLLAYPHYARKWIPQMNGPALSMLENEVVCLETRLGLRWEGGEEGYHKTDDVAFRTRGLFSNVDD